MKTESVLTKHLDKSIERVWDVIKKPAYLAIHGDVKTTTISDVEWIEHTSAAVDNHCEAVIDEATKTVTIKSKSDKYASEHDTFVLTLKADGEGSELVIDFSLYTGAIANILVMKFVGTKIVESSINKLVHHIEKMC